MENAATYYPTYVEVTLVLSVLLPLCAFLVSLLISDRYAWTISLIGPLFLLISTVCAFVTFFNVWGNVPYIISFDWFRSGGTTFKVGVLMNDLSALMLVIVSLISFLVHTYSIGYMAGDEGEKRYFGMLGLFTFCMMGIVVADNLLLVFVFWELVGFTSYMLIGHWKEKPAATEASKKAFILNRVGDAGFLVGLMILWSTGTGFEITALKAIESETLGTIAGLCIFCGVVGKSAQFPLSTWLPDAMEGPTPVSALIHAATMVAAGVFLLARVVVLFDPFALFVITLIGIATALMAALAALVQNDIKKILAYSTISQLGLMVTAVGVGSWEAAMLHLFTHAFFKACLFLCAGSIIHVLHQAQHQSHLHFDVQDIRNLGGLKARLPFTFLAVIVSGSALAGIPFFSGFVSKEAIFTAILNWEPTAPSAKWIVLILAFVVSMLTVLYIARFVSLIFFGKEGVTSELAIAEPPPIMRAPIALLAAASVWLVASLNPFSSSGYVFPNALAHSMTLTIFSALWVIGGALVAMAALFKKKWFQSELLLQSFFIDQLQKRLFVAPAVGLSGLTSRLDKRLIDGALHGVAYIHVTMSHLAGWWDKAIIDGLVNGMATLSRLTGSFARSFQGGKIQLYIFWALFAIIIFLIWSLI